MCSVRYYRGAHGALVVYDITDINSFEHVEKWLEELRKHTEDGLPVLLIGNKSDLETKRQVTTGNAQRCGF